MVYVHSARWFIHTIDNRSSCLHVELDAIHGCGQNMFRLQIMKTLWVSVGSSTSLSNIQPPSDVDLTFLGWYTIILNSRTTCQFCNHEQSSKSHPYRINHLHRFHRLGRPFHARVGTWCTYANSPNIALLISSLENVPRCDTRWWTSAREIAKSGWASKSGFERP